MLLATVMLTQPVGLGAIMIALRQSRRCFGAATALLQEIRIFPREGNRAGKASGKIISFDLEKAPGGCEWVLGLFCCLVAAPYDVTFPVTPITGFGSVICGVRSYSGVFYRGDARMLGRFAVEW
jgi:hypothetical protein